MFAELSVMDRERVAYSTKPSLTCQFAQGIPPALHDLAGKFHPLFEAGSLTVMRKPSGAAVSMTVSPFPHSGRRSFLRKNQPRELPTCVT
jgi:hypothetical protein